MRLVSAAGLAPAHGQARRDPGTPGLVLFAPVFRVVPRAPGVAPEMHELTMETLAGVRERPFASSARNLALSESVDAAEVELSHLLASFNRAPILIADPTPVSLGSASSPALRELLRRFSGTVDFVRGCGWQRLDGSALKAFEPQRTKTELTSDVGFIGEIIVSRPFDEVVISALRTALRRSTECGHVPVLVTIVPLGLPSEQLALALQTIDFVSQAGFPLHEVAVSGLFSNNPRVALEVLKSREQVMLVVDIVCNHPFTWPEQTEPHATDFAVAEAVAEAFRAGAAPRLMLGVALALATQLRKFGGSSYSSIVVFLARLEVLCRRQYAGLAVPPTEEQHRSMFEGLCSTNAVKWLAYYEPPAAPPPRVEAKLPCHQCGALKPASYDWFDLMNEKFCSSKCMRAFKAAKDAANGSNDNSGGTQRRNNDASGGVGAWGVTVQL